MNERILSVFRQLSAAFAPTGCEHERIKVIADMLGAAGIDCSTDRRGSLTAVLHGRESGAGLAFATHIDSHGMLITSVADDVASFEPVSDIRTDTLYGKLVSVRGGDRSAEGVICAVPLHLTARRDALKIPSADDMFISTGNTGNACGTDNTDNACKSVDTVDTCSACNSGDAYDACNSDYTRDTEHGLAHDCCADGRHPGISPGDYIAISHYDAVLGDRLLVSTSAESCGAAAAMLTVLLGLSGEGFVPRHDISFIFAVGGKSAVPDAVCAVRGVGPQALVYLTSADTERTEECIAVPCKVGRAVCAPELRSGIISAAERIGAVCRTAAELDAPVPLRALQTVGCGVPTAVIAVPTEMANAARQLCSLASLEAAALTISAIAESDMLD